MKEQIDATLERLIPQNGDPLSDSARYSLEGGKRLRPLLLLTILDTFNVPIEKGLYPACALEMIHTYSLIHDDLPSMDDDDLRRGKPSLHKAFPEWLAVLTGDFLLTLAFEVVATAPYLNEQQKNQIQQILANRSGRNGMIGGQVLDIQNEEVDLEKLFEIYQKKTGALFSAALECGGIIAESTDLSLLKNIGIHLGLAYQFADDLSDEDGATELIGINETEKALDSSFHQAIDLMKLLPNEGVQLRTFAEGIICKNITESNN